MFKRRKILGHPRSESFCGAINQSCIAGTEAAGHGVRQLELGWPAFDPILREGVWGTQPLKSDLQRAQELITWPEHLSNLLGRHTGAAEWTGGLRRPTNHLAQSYHYRVNELVVFTSINPEVTQIRKTICHLLSLG